MILWQSYPNSHPSLIYSLFPESPSSYQKEGDEEEKTGAKHEDSMDAGY